jgi:hypothetical protein
LEGKIEGQMPHCGGMHEISVRETYINGALEDVAGRRLRRAI